MRMQTSKRYDRVFTAGILLAFLLFGGRVFLENVPVGRDWARYWHPMLEYMKNTGSEFGVIWQFGGGILPISDPSSLVFDPIYNVFSVLLPYPTCTQLYVVLYWLAATLAMNAILQRFSVDWILRTVGVAAYAFGGLATAVINTQFIPIYLSISIAAFSFVRLNESRTPINYLLTILAFYYFGYSATPNIAVMTAVGMFFALPTADIRLVYTRTWLFASIPLIFPFGGLVISMFTGEAPTHLYGFSWSFHPARFISMILPEFNQLTNQTVWFDFYNGKPGSSESYFGTICLPLLATSGIFSRWFGKSLTDQQKLCARFFAVGVVLMLFSMIGLLPMSVLEPLRIVPIFWVKFPEKYLLAAFPILIATGVIRLSLTPQSERWRPVLYSLVFFSVCFLVNYSLIPDFRIVVPQYLPAVKALLVLQLVTSASAGYFWRKNAKLAAASALIAVLSWVPFTYRDFVSAMQPLGVIKNRNSAFYRSFEDRFRGEMVFLAPTATMNYCVETNSKTYKDVCMDPDASMYGHFSYFGIRSHTSFSRYNRLHYHYLEDSIADTKPKFVILSKDQNPRKFCEDLTKSFLTIVSCKVLPDPQIQRTPTLAVLELEHINKVTVDPSTTPFRLDLNVTAKFDRTRVPFFPPLGARVLVNDQEVKYETDDLGTIVPMQKSPGSTETKAKVSIVYEATPLKILALAALFWTIAALMIDRAMRSQKFVRILSLGRS